MQHPVFAIDPQLDPDALKHRFARNGRIQIEPFLGSECASALREELLGSAAWRHVLNAGARIFEADRTEVLRLPIEQRRALDEAVHSHAATGFQFRYELIRVPDGIAQRRAADGLLPAFAQFMNAPETLRFIAAVSGVDDIRFADAQATRYDGGHFLTRHDDDAAGKDRRLAYVLSLTPVWQPDWGGLLHFHDAQGGVADTFMPRFNALSLFRVPQPHNVGYVAPFAPEPRVSVTGWLRACPPPL
jgi:SM-20-related protein